MKPFAKASGFLHFPALAEPGLAEGNYSEWKDFSVRNPAGTSASEFHGIGQRISSEKPSSRESFKRNGFAVPAGGSNS